MHGLRTLLSEMEKWAVGHRPQRSCISQMSQSTITQVASEPQDRQRSEDKSINLILHSFYLTYLYSKPRLLVLAGVGEEWS